jgi:predicted secreted hydrolase
MDHEFMTNALQEYQTGWDWFSLYHISGKRMMLFQVRSNELDKVYKTGKLVSKDGSAEAVDKSAMKLEPTRFWKSENSDASYPVDWKLRVGDEIIELQALLDSQELTQKLGENTLAYWEGAVISKDRQYIGFLEMTGYGSAVPEI